MNNNQESNNYGLKESMLPFLLVFGMTLAGFAISKNMPNIATLLENAQIAMNSGATLTHTNREMSDFQMVPYRQDPPDVLGLP